jgi:hypothetical protein
MVGAIRYESGQSHHPISPGRTVIEFDAGGEVTLSYERLASKRRWTARQEPTTWMKLNEALGEAHFPERLPPGPVMPDTISFTISRRVNDAVEIVSLVPNPQYAKFSALVLSVIAQMTGREILGFDLPGEPRYVTDAREQ